MAETLDKQGREGRTDGPSVGRERRCRGVTGDPSLVVDVDGFEGPLDLLLHLARNQKVDLARISILALVEQYLAFVERRGRCGSNWPPTISSWRPGSPT